MIRVLEEFSKSETKTKHHSQFLVKESDDGFRRADNNKDISKIVL